MLGKIIGIIGGLAGIASLLLPWAKLVFIKFGESSVKQYGGLELTQGIIAGAAAGIGLIILFIKPKLASVFGGLAIVGGLWYLFSDIMSTPKKPALGLWVTFLAGAMLIAASFMIKPKNKNKS